MCFGGVTCRRESDDLPGSGAVVVAKDNLDLGVHHSVQNRVQAPRTPTVTVTPSP